MTFFTSPNISKLVIEFIRLAGKTTVKTRALKGAGKPAKIKAVPKKTDPLTKVPIKDKIKTFIFSERTPPLIPSKNLIRKNTKFAVINLSTILATCPPGKLVVKAVSKPETKPTVKAVL